MASLVHAGKKQVCACLLRSEGSWHGGLGPEGGHKGVLLLGLLLLVIHALRCLGSFLIGFVPKAHLPSLGLHIHNTSEFRVQG